MRGYTRGTYLLGLLFLAPHKIGFGDSVHREYIRDQITTVKTASMMNGKQDNQSLSHLVNPISAPRMLELPIWKQAENVDHLATYVDHKDFRYVLRDAPQ